MVYDTYGEYAAGSNVVVIGTFPQQNLVTVTFELFAIFLRDNFFLLNFLGNLDAKVCHPPSVFPCQAVYRVAGHEVQFGGYDGVVLPKYGISAPSLALPLTANCIG